MHISYLEKGSLQIQLGSISSFMLVLINRIGVSTKLHRETVKYPERMACERDSKGQGDVSTSQRLPRLSQTTTN